MRVLIAEDEDVLREIIARVMRRAGHDVTETANAEEALLAFRDNPFPLVVTDIVMGEMSGLDLLRAIRMQDEDAVIVVMTSYASLETATAAVRAGAYDLIIKPFEDLSVILGLLRRVEDRISLLEENRRLNENLDLAANEIEGHDNAFAATLVRDGLTGLYRASYFRHLLETEIARCRRHARTSSLVVIDVTDVSPGADTPDDQLLRAAASLLASRCRTTDVPARYGRAGFAVILPETGGGGAETFAQAARQLIAAARSRGDGAAPAGALSISAGVVTFPAHDDDASLLLDRATAALARAKGVAGGRVVVWTETEPASDVAAPALNSGNDTAR